MATELSDCFKYWDTYHESVQLLSDEQAGQFIKALGAYVFEGINPDFHGDKMVELVYHMAYKHAVRSKDISSQARKWGKSGGRPSKKRDAKTPPLSTPKTPPLREPKRVPKTPPESDKKRIEAKRSERPLKGRSQAASVASLAAPERGASARAANEIEPDAPKYEMAPGEIDEMMATVEANVRAWDEAGRPDDWPVGGENDGSLD